MKVRSSRRLQVEFRGLKKRCWGAPFLNGYGCWSTGNITDEIGTRVFRAPSTSMT